MNRNTAAAVASPLWGVAQGLGLLLTIGLLAALVRWPEPSLRILWYAVIPILPATFLINTQLWRNVCPLATLTTLTGDRVGSRTIRRNWVGIVGGVGIILLAVMVPARRFLFNTEGAVLAVAVGAVAFLALLGGLLFHRRAGFCNSICPVLPVERLYGQRPLLQVPNARCTQCTLCTGLGCLDLTPEKSGLQVLGNSRATRKWPFTAFGAFALGFPGFVTGYYLLSDVPLSSAPGVYGTIALWALGSWLVLVVAFSVLGVSPGRALLLCGGLAVGLYYWFAPVGIADAFSLGPAFSWSARIVTLSLVGFWLLRGLSPLRGAEPLPAPNPAAHARNRQHVRDEHAQPT
jgi:hypothetical protein